MKLTVVIPVYNEENYLESCLQQLMDQEVKADEVIVVDNNSKDNSVAIAQKFPVKIISEKTQGITPARNAGFNSAKGDIIARCDADTHLPSDWVKKVKLFFENNTADAVTGPATSYDFPLLSFLPWTKLYHHIARSAAGHFTLVGFNMAMTRKIWEKVKNDVCLDDTLVHDDVDLSIHINRVGGTIVYSPTLIVSTSSRRITKNIGSFFIEYPRRFRSTLAIHHK